METKQKSANASRAQISRIPLLAGQRSRRLRIDRRFVYAAFGREEHGATKAGGCFLNLHTGRFLWLPPASGREFGRRVPAHMQASVGSAPKGGEYLEIPALSSTEHQKFICAFLASEWTADWELRSFTALAYDGSIENWIRRVPESARRAFEQFKSSLLLELAERYLRDQGINPEWS